MTVHDCACTSELICLQTQQVRIPSSGVADNALCCLGDITAVTGAYRHEQWRALAQLWGFVRSRPGYGVDQNVSFCVEHKHIGRDHAFFLDPRRCHNNQIIGLNGHAASCAPYPALLVKRVTQFAYQLLRFVGCSHLLVGELHSCFVATAAAALTRCRHSAVRASDAFVSQCGILTAVVRPHQ